MKSDARVSAEAGAYGGPEADVRTDADANSGPETNVSADPGASAKDSSKFKHRPSSSFPPRAIKHKSAYGVVRTGPILKISK